MHGKNIAEFKKTIWNYYRDHGRSLPWRETHDPYHVLVSEVMLQQTQVPRVLKKYPEFLSEFPTIHDLAKARLSNVLRVWQGMGYNRRGKTLHELSKRVVSNYNGVIPKRSEELLALPGVGPSTAGGVLAFAFNKPEVFIETNIRRVFIHHFFENTRNIRDADIEPFVKQTLDQENPREWYYALFDYGSALVKTVPNPNQQSSHYKKQSRFEGSHRQLRSHLLRALLENKTTENELSKASRGLKKTKKEVDTALAELEKEGFVVRHKNHFLLKQ